MTGLLWRTPVCKGRVSQVVSVVGIGICVSVCWSGGGETCYCLMTHKCDLQSPGAPPINPF